MGVRSKGSERLSSWKTELSANKVDSGSQYPVGRPLREGLCSDQLANQEAR